jgi:hypothetical protein
MLAAAATAAAGIETMLLTASACCTASHARPQAFKQSSLEVAFVALCLAGKLAPDSTDAAAPGCASSSKQTSSSTEPSRQQQQQHS